ncbi:Acg family FMN-binding oxidoreductase [Rubrivirga litoralis]|uniref:Nitroreductase family protein n=1 Tax=Rubrivirga litoralis TaxID=3075598 RepID=A0ABU3BNI6_9BACT|nr:nitroreductase family protein [Rubrivirga sp. F394]MDT0630852.1 nitroreductase family protein [Rubrivirga sp. F394]
MPDAPDHRPTDADIEEILEHAVRAPSLLNSQPWRFVVGDGTVRLYADRARQLSALDPDGRELTMSCGAALLYLRVAAWHFGWEPLVDALPDDAGLLATVTFRPAPSPSGDDRPFRALALRHTNRLPFEDEPVPFGVPSELAGAVATEGAALYVFDDEDGKDALARLVEEGVAEQGRDREVVAEIERWLRPARDARPDGVRDSEQGTWDRHATTRTTTSAVATYKGRLVRDSPAVLVLATAADGPADWLAAGQALARALVVAADRGLAASYANEPIEVDSLRPRVAALIGDGVPQALFRVGYPTPEPATSRRRAADVTERAGGAADG